MSTWREDLGTSKEAISLMQSIFANVSDAIGLDRRRADPGKAYLRALLGDGNLYGGDELYGLFFQTRTNAVL